jgi:Zn-dependent protease with chaperone function
MSFTKSNAGWLGGALSLQTGLFVVTFTLLVWIGFSYTPYPLDAGATGVVALVLVILAIGAQALWSRLRKDTDPTRGEPS